MGHRESRNVYVGVVSFLGLAALLVQIANLSDEATHASFWVLGILVVLSETFPLRIQRPGGSVEEITTATTFSFALLLLISIPAAVVAQAVASLTDDVIRKKPGRKTLFNISQYTLAMVAAGTAFEALTDRAATIRDIDTVYLLAILISAALFFLVNNALTDAAIAFEEHRPLATAFSTNLGFQAFTDAVLLGLAPIAVLIAKINIALVLLLVLPIVAVARGASSSLRNARLAREMHHLATHDPLTGLPNRSAFLTRLENAVRHLTPGSMVAILLMDLDRFKEINDTLGHHNGDNLLQQVGARLREEIPGEFTVAHIGGDEFAILVEPESLTQAISVAEHVLRCFEPPFVLGDLPVEAGVSIGMALCPEHGTNPNALVQRADVAMYQAKEARTGFTVYEPEQDPYSVAALSLVPELRQATGSGNLLIHYQPKVALDNGHVLGVEALLRWNHPRLGLVGPDRFIPVAERTGLIKQITLFVLDESIRQIQEWSRTGVDLNLAVNLSAYSLHDPTLTDDIERALSRWGVPAESVELEITESALMADPLRAAATLRELTDMGLQIAIDDFGTGYSSLSRLRDLPVSTIKIDKSFTIGLPRSDDDITIVRSTIDLAHNLGLSAVAEGVESENVWRRLAELGCDFAQGDYVSRPVTAHALTTWVRGRTVDAVRHPGRSRRL